MDACPATFRPVITRYWTSRLIAFALVPVLSLAGCKQEQSNTAGVTSSLTPVLTGADVLVQNSFEPLSGLRVGLIANHTARSNDRHLADLLHSAENVELVALFGPEHGLRGDKEAGEEIDDQIDDRTGVPIYSLYGSSRRPTRDMLGGVDALVFDIQDVGARFYTYISTMGLSMQSAAENNLTFFVLDRPNPLGGLTMEGFVLDTTYSSFVGRYPIPQRHGLTVGELAQMIRGEGWLPAVDSLDLKVIEMQDWKRHMLWPDTGLQWIPPSPNLPTFDAALVYPGTALFEATSANEGRGTDVPFLTIGVPWIRPEEIISGLTPTSRKGLTLRAGRVTPRDIPGKVVNPRFEGREIPAILIEVTDPAEVRSVTFGLELVRSFYAAAPDTAKPEFFNARWMHLLTGTDRVLQMLKSGRLPVDMESAWQNDIYEFGVRRKPYLIYR